MSQSKILWAQVAGLAAVQGAIALTWVIYNLYLLELLTGLGFSQTLGVALLILENALAAVMEPLMGSLSDQAQRWVGSRFPQIALGMIVAAGCFLAIPIAFWVGSGGLRLLLPVAAVLWALAMTVFRSPALSLLGRYAYESQLPQAAGLLTLVGGVTGAMAPLASGWILALGPGWAFALGTGVLLGAAWVLRWVQPETGLPQPLQPQTGRVSWRKLLPNLILIFGIGVAIALGLRLLLQYLPVQFGALGAAQGNRVLVAVFVTVALTALPCGALAARVGNRAAMATGLALLCGLSGLLLQVGSMAQVWGLAVLVGLAFSLVANGTLPFALSMVPPQKGGLGTGLYFSGGAVAMSGLGTVTQRVGELSPAVSLSLSAVSFAAAAMCLALSLWRQPVPSPASKP